VILFNVDFQLISVIVERLFIAEETVKVHLKTHHGQTRRDRPSQSAAIVARRGIIHL
jgi:hypothetical protein